ncbi:MAG: excinuclease ABC subunit UvrC [bacterium]|nr:excinuclease ABC subunit UvrC [bacterium]
MEFVDDKTPRLLIVRNPNAKKNKNLKLYGPYPNVMAARKTVDMLNRIYPLRKCKNLGKKECLYYHIKECLGYCTNKVDEIMVDNMKSEIVSFLNGNHKIVTDRIKEKMMLCSKTLQFEKAKEYKELLDYINITLEKQHVELHDYMNRDVVGYYHENGYLSIQLLFIRGGKLLDRNSMIFPMIDTLEEEITSYLMKFYDKHKIKPQEVLVPEFINCQLFSDIFGIKFINPKRGAKNNVVALANENAYIAYYEKMELIKRDEARSIDANDELANILNIENLSRIEIFDNSNLFGSFNVSGMVVFINGKPYKKEYRKFKIQNNKNDDYHTMEEVIYRRYFKVINEGLVKPELIIVDGGRLQVMAARRVLQSLNLDIEVCGLKKDKKHNTNVLVGGVNLEEIEIDKSSNLFHLLTRIQNEVHNFTINYHKQIRSKGALESVIDGIDGIGKTRKNMLLKKYKTIDKMKEASLDELSVILPKNVAGNLYEFLNDVGSDENE